MAGHVAFPAAAVASGLSVGVQGDVATAKAFRFRGRTRHAGGAVGASFLPASLAEAVGDAFAVENFHGSTSRGSMFQWAPESELRWACTNRSAASCVEKTFSRQSPS